MEVNIVGGTQRDNAEITEQLLSHIRETNEHIMEIRRPKLPGQMVREFHNKFDLPSLDSPQYPSVKRRHLRQNLIEEEIREFRNEITKTWHHSEGESDGLADAAKEAADVIYVLHGWALEHGIDLDAVFSEVHRSNMTKLWEDGTVKKRDDGKILKPPTYEPADIQGVLFEM